MTIKECATKIGLHPGTIRRLILEGKLKSHKLYEHRNAPYVIEQSDLDEFLSKVAKPEPVSVDPTPVQPETIPEAQPVVETPVKDPILVAKDNGTEVLSM